MRKVLALELLTGVLSGWYRRKQQTRDRDVHRRSVFDDGMAEDNTKEAPTTARRPVQMPVPPQTRRGWDRARSQLTRGQLELRGGMTASIAQDGSRKLFVRATLELKKHAHPGSPCGRSLHLSC